MSGLCAITLPRHTSNGAAADVGAFANLDFLLCMQWLVVLNNVGSLGLHGYARLVVPALVSPVLLLQQSACAADMPEQ